MKVEKNKEICYVYDCSKALLMNMCNNMRKEKVINNERYFYRFPTEKLLLSLVCKKIGHCFVSFARAA